MVSAARDFLVRHKTANFATGVVELAGQPPTTIARVAASDASVPPATAAGVAIGRPDPREAPAVRQIDRNPRPMARFNLFRSVSR
jgi:hypothetical protein